MIAVWGILSVLNLSEILEQGIHDAGVRHWIILGLGMTAERILELNKNELYMNRPL